MAEYRKLYLAITSEFGRVLLPSLAGLRGKVPVKYRVKYLAKTVGGQPFRETDLGGDLGGHVLKLEVVHLFGGSGVLKSLCTFKGFCCA